MAPHSSTLAWKIPWTEEPGRLQSMGQPMGSLGVGHDWATMSLSLFTFMHWRRKWQPTPVENPRDGGAWWATVSGVASSDLAAAAAATLCHEHFFLTTDWNFKILPSCWNWLCGSCSAAAAKSLQSCPTLCDPIDSSPPGSTVPGILQARTLEWVAISFSNAWEWKVKVKSLSRVRLLATPWTAAFQAPPPMGFSRQEYWSGVPLLSCVLLFATPWGIARQAPLSMGFSRQDYWSGLLFSSPGKLID